MEHLLSPIRVGETEAQEGLGGSGLPQGTHWAVPEVSLEPSVLTAQSTASLMSKSF